MNIETINAPISNVKKENFTLRLKFTNNMSKSEAIRNSTRKYLKEITKVQKQVKIRILKGAEVDILKDGSLDYPDKILKKLDILHHPKALYCNHFQ